jgi:hypothetical protein
VSFAVAVSISYTFLLVLSFATGLLYPVLGLVTKIEPIRTLNMKQSVRKKKITKRVCYHEAGHAVMAWRKGIVYSVSALPDEKRRGFIKFHGSCNLDEENIRICLAGYTAYAIWMKISYFAAMVDGGMDDFKKAKETSAEYSRILSNGCSASEIMKRAECDTKSWIRSYWPAVEALSKALYVNGSLNGKEVKGIIIKEI